MNDRPDKADGRLEEMLCRWGVDEAIRQVDQVPLRVRPPSRARWMRLVWQVGAVAAAAIVLLAGGMLYVNRGSDGAAQMPQAAFKVPVVYAPAPDAERIGQLEEQLSAATKAYQVLQDDLAEKDKQLTRQQAALTDAKRELTQLRMGARSLRTRTQAELAAMTDKVTTSGKNILALQTRLASATKELTNARMANFQATVDKRRVEDELAQLRARHAMVLARLLEPNHAATESEPASVTDRQSAARLRRLLQRCAEFHTSAGEADVVILDRIEVILLRLDMLDAKNLDNAKSFEKLLTTAGIARLIDDALSAAQSTIELRMWLYEVRMILLGVNRVG